jgi:hypothetical protein
MKVDGGVRSGLLATSVNATLVRSAARNNISLIGFGHASASTQIRMALTPLIALPPEWRRHGALYPGEARLNYRRQIAADGFVCPEKRWAAESRSDRLA